MTYDTSGTSADPELGTEGDTDQLSGDDTLDPADLLDDGYAPPDERRANHWGETPWEEVHGEPLVQRLAEEEPDVWDSDGVDRTEGPASRSGLHLVEDPDGRFPDDL